MKAPVAVPRCTLPLLALALVAAGCATHPPAAPEGAAKKVVVAKVNGVPLYSDALAETVERMRSSRHVAPASGTEEARRRALDQMVLQELAAQEAARQGVRVKEKDLNDAMNALIRDLGHGEGFEAFLKERRLTAEDVRSQVGRRLLLEAIYDREVRTKVSVPSEEVRKEYDLNREKYVSPETAAVTDIAFSQTMGTPAMLRKAEEVIAALKADRDPRTVPADGIFTVLDRDIDGRREPLLFGAARILAEGQYSGLVETPAGSHILKLVRMAPGRQLTYEEARDAIERKLRGLAEMKRLAEWQEELRKSAVIELTGGDEPSGDATTARPDRP